MWRWRQSLEWCSHKSTKTWKLEEARKGSPLEVLEGAWPCWYFGGFWPPEMWQNNFALLCHLICGNLRQQLQKMNTGRVKGTNKGRSNPRAQQQWGAITTPGAEGQSGTCHPRASVMPVAVEGGRALRTRAIERYSHCGTTGVCVSGINTLSPLSLPTCSFLLEPPLGWTNGRLEAWPQVLQCTQIASGAQSRVEEQARGTGDGVLERN